MEKPTHMYDVMWPKARRLTSQQNKAIIAARFEGCTQSFSRLSASLTPLLPETTANLLQDCFGRFVTWGAENGANDQTLDYRLRKSKDTRELIAILLSQLQEVLDEGVQLSEVDESHNLTGSLILPDEDDFGSGRDSSLNEVAPEVTLSGSQTLQTLDATNDILESIKDTVESLSVLGPTLTKPYPEDVDTLSSSVASTENGDLEDVNLAKELFPSASKVLQTRLGRANWHRKLAQKQSRQGAEGVRNKKGFKNSKRTARQQIAQDAFNFQKPFLNDASKPSHMTPFLPIFSVPSSIAPSEAETTSVSVFSKANLGRVESSVTMTTMTTMSSAIPMKSMIVNVLPPSRASRTQVATLPLIPIPLEEIRAGESASFTCNLCGYDLEAGTKIKTEEDWKQHVFEDLEPYLCTFDDCFSAQEMYAIRDEWYKHELQTHRIRKVWVCGSCKAEFVTKKLAEDHLDKHGDEFDEEDMIMMKAMLRHTYSNKPLKSSSCPLCQDKIPPEGAKDHIARHLENFALLSIIGDESTEEDDSDEIFSQSNDDAMSDRGRKETILNTFVTEQLKLNLDRGKQPPDRYLEGETAGFDLFENRSDYDGSRDSDSHAGGGRGDSRNILMERMLQRDASTAMNKASRLANSSGIMAGPPSLTSSNDKLPLLRTSGGPRNEDFMGRDKELANLYKILSEPGRVSIVSGEGGMGKTALAVEFSWRYAHCYHYVFWVQAETPVGSSETFCQIAIQLGLAQSWVDTDTLVKLGREYLEQETEKRWLLIFDNVNMWTDIDIYTPTKTSDTNGSILITTRHESLTATSRPINYFRTTLQELEMEEGRKLLIHRLPQDLKPQEMSLRDPEYKIAGEIAALAGLPLLITYISGYIKQSDCKLSEFWDYWQDWRPKARIAGSSEADNTLNSVLHIALGDLSNDAQKVLRIMAFLDSDGIQWDLLVRNDNVKPGPMYLKTNRLRVIMTNLISQKFVTETKSKHANMDVYNIHRVLQSRLLIEMNGNPKERDEIFRVAFELVRHHLPRPAMEGEEFSKGNNFNSRLPHVLSLERFYSDPLAITSPTPFLGLAELFKDGGVLLWQRFFHGDSLKLLKSAERILDELELDEPNLRAEISITINLLLQYFGISHRKESKERLARILEFRRKIVDRKLPSDRTREDEIILMDASADYANSLLQFNDYEAAEPIYQDCYKKYLELGAESDPNATFALAKLNHHMAYCKMYRHEFAEAIALAEKAVAIIDKLGDRQITLRYQFDQACIVLQSGDLEKAMVLHREILEQRLGFQGRASYFSLQSQYAYAALCHYMGRLDEAEKWMRTALNKANERGGKNFWPDAAVARAKYHLSQVLRDSHGGELTDEAAMLARDAKDVLSKMLPYDPDPIIGVTEEDAGALFDHLQPCFGGRFTGLSLLKYVS